MNQLTPEQIKTLEDAFVSLPEDFKVLDSKYANMIGIKQQLDEDQKTIFYISKADMTDKNHPHYTL